VNYSDFKDRTEAVLRQELHDKLTQEGQGYWMETVRQRANLPPGFSGPPQERDVELLPLELIWSYWLEEGGLVQTMHAVSLRFQNKARGSYRALARFDVSPLLPLSELLWGYIQDETHRLSIRRRAYEYLYQYGLRIAGKAVGALAPADTRSRFLQAFHELLNACVRYYRQLDDLTVTEDPRLVLAKLKELHLVLAHGAHNQYGDLPFQARLEMRIIQEILAHPELRDFLGGRPMIPYPEPWMDRVDSMRQIMRWGDGSITDFHNLAVYGEMILLAVRRGPFGPTQPDPTVAGAFANGLRNAIMQYLSSYQAVTGVDVGSETHGKPVDATPPSVYLDAREARMRRAG
jgi:hypothetical protein